MRKNERARERRKEGVRRRKGEEEVEKRGGGSVIKVIRAPSFANIHGSKRKLETSRQ